jgi:hypothetical protein
MNRNIIWGAHPIQATYEKLVLSKGRFGLWTIGEELKLLKGLNWSQ